MANTEDADATVRVVLDFSLLVLVALPSLVFKVGVDPFTRGFFCDDESIAHPYKSSTIPTSVLFVVGAGLPITVMLLTELFLYRWRSKRTNNALSRMQEYSACQRSIHPFFVTCYQLIGAFLFGCATCQTSTDITKYSIGRLRPHFLDVCKPAYSLINCSSSSGHGMAYIEDDVCTGDPHLIKEARLSHVSGHGSFSAYTMIFLVFYLQSRMTWEGSNLLRPFLQAICIFLSIYTCMSRISDYMHHWSDVLGGAILGVVVAFLVVFFVSNLFRPLRLRDIARKLSVIRRSYSSNSKQEVDATDLDTSSLPKYESSESVDLRNRNSVKHKPRCTCPCCTRHDSLLEVNSAFTADEKPSLGVELKEVELAAMGDPQVIL